MNPGYKYHKYVSHFSDETKKQVVKRDGLTCAICKRAVNYAWLLNHIAPYRWRKGVAVEFDHIVPDKQFGSKDTAENCRILCEDCNLKAAVESGGRIGEMYFGDRIAREFFEAEKRGVDMTAWVRARKPAYVPYVGWLRKPWLTNEKFE